MIGKFSGKFDGAASSFRNGGNGADVEAVMDEGDRAASLAGGRLTIDLDAVVANLRHVEAATAPARVAAVVKADAYGLGAGPVAAALAGAGCRDFFVADLAEALDLRPHVGGQASIHVLHGLWPGTESLAEEAGVTPVLNSLAQVRAWAELARKRRRRLPAVLQLDSGMSRLGLSDDDVAALAAEPQGLEALDVNYVMSHLASADQAGEDVNAAQRASFERLAGLLPARPRTLANSAAALGDPLTHGDLVRAGLALYGVAPGPGPSAGLRPVVSLSARVIQVRTLPAGTGVGYGLTYTTRGTERIATVGVGYADGWPRALSNRGAAWFGGVRLPIVGQVSMDSMMVDVSALAPEALGAGDAVELIGPHQSVADVAALAGTIPYEILTRLGRRYARRYVGGASAQGMRA